MSVSWRWRILAVLSLVLLGALVVLAVLFTLHNVLLLLAVALTTALVLYASWLVFGGSGRRYFGGWLLLIVSGLLLIVEATRLFTREHNLKLLSAMALVGVVYVLLVARLRTVYWQQRRQAARPHGTAPAHHHPVLIVNPKSGDGRAIKADIPQKARSMGIDVRVLAKGDDISAMAKRAVGEGGTYSAYLVAMAAWGLWRP